MLTIMRLMLLALLGFSSAAASMCYCKNDDTLYSSCRGAIPCGQVNEAGFVQCCAPGDTCGADGFCHFTHSQNGTSGYYLGSCTDPNFQDSSCPQTCTNFPSEDVVYNATSGLWACCYGTSGTLDCSNPGQETFQAKKPEDLFAIPFSLLTSATMTSTAISKSTSSVVSKSTSLASSQSTSTLISQSTSSVISKSTSTTDSVFTPSPTVATQIQSTSDTSTGLSIGAKLAIGIIVAVFVVVVLTGIVMLSIRKSRKGRFFGRQSDGQRKAMVHEIGGQSITSMHNGSPEYMSSPEKVFLKPGLGNGRRPLLSELPANYA